MTSTLRRNEDWLPTQPLGGGEEIAGLLGPLRRGMHAAGKVGVAHYLAVDRLVRGREKLWVPARSITDPRLQTPFVVEAACRRGWVPMPRGSETGERMLQAAKDAVGATLRVLPELDRAFTARRPSAASRGWAEPASRAHRRSRTRLRGRPLSRRGRRKGATTRAARLRPAAVVVPHPMSLTLSAWELTARMSPRRVVRASAVDAGGRPVNAYPRESTPSTVASRSRRGRST
ncbi:hypothetical protein [Propioniciclava sinopodophylli]|uniref:hypothetical protein n=1 Tax=Propioniciclava sinopodophylli TaxID=1837344 RepID=UPI002491920D|nr:hypothetical protein [Propioniciclava sinopodophylli]